MKRSANPNRSTDSGTGRVACAACAFDLSIDGDLVHILPSGEFRARDGRPKNVDAWRLDASIADQVIATARRNGIRIPIDYDHQILHAEDNGQPAPAAGWIDPASLEWRDGKGLFGRAEWTAKARAHIDANEYRYLSAVFPYSKTSGNVLDLLMVSLTNFPALTSLDDIQQLAAARFTLSDNPTEEHLMNKELLKLLGLSDEADDDAVLAACKAIIANRDELIQKVATLDTSIADLKGKLDDGAPDPAKFVSVDVVEELKSEIAQLSGKMVASEVDDVVTAALTDGRLLAAQEQWARDYGKKDLSGLKGYLENARPIAALKGTQSGGKPPAARGDGTLTEDEIAVCRACGIEPDDYKKANGIDKPVAA